MKHYHIKRLLKLAKHLEGPARNRLHAEFDFSCLSIGENDGRGSYCGTLGCALGECPAVFPRQWKIVIRPEDGKTNSVSLRGKLPVNAAGSAFASAQRFFGLYQEESFHLFNPGSQRPKSYGGSWLCGDATAKQVARNIRAFIKHKQKASNQPE